MNRFKHKTRKNKQKGIRKSNLQLLSMCMPAILKVLVFSYIPLIWAVIAFQNFIPRKGILFSEFIGFANFQYLFNSSLAFRLVRNAIVMNVLFLVFGTLVSLLLGLFLFEIKKKLMVKGIQTVIIFPYFLSWPLVGVLVSVFLNKDTGMMTNFLYSLTGVKINFYAKGELWWGILTFANVWKYAGLNAVVYYALLMGVDKELYEAASIDGASRFSKMWHISLPELKLMIIVSIIMNCSNILRMDFNLVYFVTDNQSPLEPYTEVIETYMFKALRTSNNWGASTAVGLFQGFVGLVLTYFTNIFCKKVSGNSLY